MTPNVAQVALAALVHETQARRHTLCQPVCPQSVQTRTRAHADKGGAKAHQNQSSTQPTLVNEIQSL